MVMFQRARSDEQRAARRLAILNVATDMLHEMPVSEISLNELSRRVGLAKSNVLRYFESREAVLLELLDSSLRGWLGGLERELCAAVEPGAPLRERGDQVAAALAASLASRPVLCDLIAAQAAVLERNVSSQAAAQYKRTSAANIAALGGLILAQVPELGERDAGRFAAGVVLVTSGLWPYEQPAPAMLAAYQSNPDLAAMRIDFTATLREVLEVLMSGLHARAGR
jgi:AcrR family transcriptional regulator